MNMKWITALITSFSYNRTRDDVISLIVNTKARINNEGYFRCGYGNDDVDILFGAICILYGDYGTSPRSGWIDESYKPHVLKILDEQLDYYHKLPEE